MYRSILTPPFVTSTYSILMVTTKVSAVVAQITLPLHTAAISYLQNCVKIYQRQLQVNISGQCREEILSKDVTALDIFDRARAEVLVVMEVNLATTVQEGTSRPIL